MGDKTCPYMKPPILSILLGMFPETDLSPPNPPLIDSQVAEVVPLSSPNVGTGPAAQPSRNNAHAKVTIIYFFVHFD